MITLFTPTDMDNYKNRIDDSTQMESCFNKSEIL